MDYIPGGGRRPAPAQQSSAQPEPAKSAPAVDVTPTTTQPATAYRQTKPADKKPKYIKKVLLAVAALIVIALAVGFFLLRSGTNAIDSGKYQAVFFTNGQVYFGKLQPLNGEYMKLTKVFYLQTKTASTGDKTNPQQTASENADVQLIKLGDEVHGPEDEMIISKDQVLFYENLKSDGKVSASIAQYLDKK